MNKQTELMLVEEFSDLELEAISGGANNNNVIGISVDNNNVEIAKNVSVAAAAAVAVLGAAGAAGRAIVFP